MMGEAYCNESGVLHVIYLIKLGLSIIRIVIPILLIMVVMFDVFKLVVSKDMEIRKTTKKIVRRFLAAALLFLVPTILNFILGILGNTTSIELSSCWLKATKENIRVLKQEEKEKAQKEQDKRREEFTQSSKDRDKKAKQLRKKLVFSTSTSKDSFKAEALNKNAKEGSCLPSAYQEGKYGEAIVKKARQYVGKTPYVWGGTSLTNGADCSGFTQGIYKEFGIHISRTSFSQMHDGAPVSSITEARAGDLLIFSNHVGIYSGNGKMVHASCESIGTVESAINSGPIIGIRRIVC